MLKLKNNKWVNLTNKNLLQKETYTNKFFQNIKSLNINLNELNLVKEKIQRFIEINEINQKVLIIQCHNYIYFVLIGINNEIGIITQVYNINHINIKQPFNYLENKDFILKLFPNFKNQHYWNYYFNKYKICGSIKKNIFKFNKGTAIYELI